MNGGKIDKELYISAAERIDGLIRIAYDEKIAVKS